MKTRDFLLLIVFNTLVSGLFAQETVHILSKGETLYSIARQYGVSYQEIIRENSISDPRRLQVGQRIVIPSSQSAQTASVTYTQHTVVRGETLYGIARQYSITISQLRTANNLSEASVLREGAVLRIPQSGLSIQQPANQHTQAPEKTEAPAVSEPPAAISDARSLVTGELDDSVRWPIQAKDIAYMTGKLQGVVLGGEYEESVFSLSSGTVVSAGPYRGFGRVVIIQAPDSYLYVYGGCESLSVQEGDSIRTGSILGKLGIDALSEKPQLFLMVYKNDKAMDPAKAPR